MNTPVDLRTYDQLLRIPRQSLPPEVMGALGTDMATRHGFSTGNERYTSGLVSAKAARAAGTTLLPPDYTADLRTAQCYPRVVPFSGSEQGTVQYQLFFVTILTKLENGLICGVYLSGMGTRCEAIAGVTNELFLRAFVYPPIKPGWIPLDYELGQVFDLAPEA